MDDHVLRAQIHLKAALNFAHQAAVKNDQVHELMHNARHEADIASRQAVIYFAMKNRTPMRNRGRVLPSFWYVPGGVKDYLSDKSIDAWDFDSHIPKLNLIQRSLPIFYLPLRPASLCRLNDFI